MTKGVTIQSGRTFDWYDVGFIWLGNFCAGTAFCIAYYAFLDELTSKAAMAAAESAGIMAIAFFAMAMEGKNERWMGIKIIAYGALVTILTVMLGGVQEAGRLNLPGAAVALGSIFTYGLMCLGVMAGEDDFWGIK